MYVCMYVCMYVYVCICMYINMCACMGACILLSKCAYPFHSLEERPCPYILTRTHLCAYLILEYMVSQHRIILQPLLAT